MAVYKQYVIEFKLGDGTTHKIPFKVPPGENGGYYTPIIKKKSDTLIEISFTPSKADMPAVNPVQLELPALQGSGGNVDLTGYAKEQWVQENYQPKGEYLESSKLTNAVNTALTQAKESGEFDGKTAYQYAQYGGYTGTEEDFALKLAEESVTPVELNTAVKKAAPRNLLDNSDFRNPVNQRGITVSNNGFIVDRWYAFDGDVTISENGIFTTGNGYIQQRLLSGTIKPESVYTLAVYYSDGTADVNTNGEYASIADFDIVNYIRSNGKTISAVALYEGEYTIDTLPEYQSKGYANELLVCNQYDPETGEYIGITSTPTDAVLKSNVVNNFTTTKEGFVADARALKTLNDSKMSMDLLWENPSPTSEFDSRTITMDLSKYTFFAIESVRSTSVIVYGLSFVGYGDSTIYSQIGGVQGGVYMSCRNVRANNDGIYFDLGVEGNAGNLATGAGFTIPVRIYGIKGVSV